MTMPALPTAEDIDKAREQASAVVNEVLSQARTPLLAVLGAGDVAARTVRDALERARKELAERAEAAKDGIGELQLDTGQWREKFDPAELRKLVDAYSEAAVRIYGTLAERGEETLGRLRAQPRVQQAFDQVGAGVDTAQERVETVVEDVRELADDVLGKVSRSTRSTGEKVAVATRKAADETARAVRDTAEEAADAVTEAGASAASATRSTSRKAANRTPRKAPTGGARRGQKKD
ncbi:MULTISPECIES: hypothetical protein [Actinoalloteichus]|nr:hypothetical protein [Actinoalloteichus caeruleus]